MTMSEFEDFICNVIGLETRVVLDKTGIEYFSFTTSFDSGDFSNQVIEIAMRRSKSNPLLPDPSIHVRPCIAPFGPVNKDGMIIRNVIKSNLGDEWQYWSTRYSKQPSSPQEIWSQIIYIFTREYTGEAQ